MTLSPTHYYETFNESDEDTWPTKRQRHGAHLSISFPPCFLVWDLWLQLPLKVEGSCQVFTWLFSSLRMWRSISSPAAFSFPQSSPFPSCCLFTPCCKTHSGDLSSSTKTIKIWVSLQCWFVSLRRKEIEASFVCIVQSFWILLPQEVPSCEAIEAFPCFCTVWVSSLTLISNLWGSSSVLCGVWLSILSWAVSLSLSAIAPPPSAYSPACKPQLTLGHSLAPGAQSSLGRHHHHHQGDHHHHHQGGHHHHHQGGHHHYQQGGHISMNNFHFLGIYHSLLISREQPIYHCFTRVSFLIAPLQIANGHWSWIL